MNGKKYTGQIVQWDEIRMFGFIQSIEALPFGGEKIFVHHSNCIDAPFLGAHVEFEIGNSYKLNRSPQAVRVTIPGNAGLEALAKGIPDDGPIKDAADISSVGASSQGGA
jgi:cold shock CspA family protein